MTPSRDMNAVTMSRRTASSWSGAGREGQGCPPITQTSIETRTFRHDPERTNGRGPLAVPRYPSSRRQADGSSGCLLQPLGPPSHLTAPPEDPAELDQVWVTRKNADAESRPPSSRFPT